MKARTTRQLIIGYFILAVIYCTVLTAGKCHRVRAEEYNYQDNYPPDSEMINDNIILPVPDSGIMEYNDYTGVII
jgi:hypothetical protein